MNLNQVVELTPISWAYVQANEAQVESMRRAAISDLENGVDRALREILRETGI